MATLHRQQEKGFSGSLRVMFHFQALIKTGKKKKKGPCVAYEESTPSLLLLSMRRKSENQSTRKKRASERACAEQGTWGEPQPHSAANSLLGTSSTDELISQGQAAQGKPTLWP